jgi:hypothetical protein
MVRALVWEDEPSDDPGERVKVNLADAGGT